MSKVKELPVDDRPREKLILRGAQSLSDAELIAILLRTGTKGQNVIQIAQSLISKYGNLNILSMQTIDAIKNFPGIGKDKAATLIAAFEISRRADAQKKWFSNKKITSPSDVAEIFIPLLRDEVKEKFYVLCLNTANKIIKNELISIGNLNSSVVHAREVFKVAIENNSANIILLHNHPSGNPEPSREDISLTKKLVEAGKLLEIQVFDHIIIAGNYYTSLVEKRLI
ncbi:MAG: DNA repair protein RadC [Melioribacter sp.]|uniref:RadC family protein n=1 Tax=Rosettibacter primus TaxID=3111523 RepID=UPI00247B4173|nr:DNA repair protein RadC [Melioribacter sp.]